MKCQYREKKQATKRIIDIEQNRQKFLESDIFNDMGWTDLGHKMAEAETLEDVKKIVSLICILREYYDEYIYPYEYSLKISPRKKPKEPYWKD